MSINIRTHVLFRIVLVLQTSQKKKSYLSVRMNLLPFKLFPSSYQNSKYNSNKRKL